ncbi:DUF3667 domain-containing protein [Pedobacter immunditicola]|uniref:DUF3667 domain-containing protein n=1 Tax=Pedobacter immunditicola TaxID=3133440 RepID=UPI0030B5F403
MSSGKYRKEKNCLNCGHQVEEYYCPHCGQENLELKEDALHMITHTIADYFHFDSKFFGTMWPLLFKPGFLSQQFVAGKRVAFIHPIRLYIFISIVFFLIILSSSHQPEVELKSGTPATTAAATLPDDSLTKARKQELRETLKSLPINEQTKDSLVNELLTDSQLTKELTDTTARRSFSTKSDWFTAKDASIADYEKRQLSLPKAERDNLFQNYLNKKSIRMKSFPDAEERIKKQILSNIPKLMFVLLPLFALILKLVYWTTKKYYYEHLIYSFHVHSALFLSVLATIFLQWLTGFFFDISTLLTWLCIIYMLWYIYRSLRTFYGSTRWLTLTKMWFLFVSYTVVFSFSALLLVVLSALMV